VNATRLACSRTAARLIGLVATGSLVACAAAPSPVAPAPCIEPRIPAPAAQPPATLDVPARVRIAIAHRRSVPLHVTTPSGTSRRSASAVAISGDV
jgi:hypothetical protein